MMSTYFLFLLTLSILQKRLQFLSSYLTSAPKKIKIKKL